jgi:hypothetical protein
MDLTAPANRPGLKTDKNLLRGKAISEDVWGLHTEILIPNLRRHVLKDFGVGENQFGWVFQRSQLFMGFFRSADCRPENPFFETP